MQSATRDRQLHDRFVRPSLPARRFIAVAVAAMAAACASNSRADQNWDGDNPIGNFSFNNNWFGDSQPAWGFGNGSLRFQFRNNTNQTSLFNDYGSWQDTNDIIWETTFGAGLPWNSAGNGFNFNQRLENRSSFTQTVNVPLSGAKNGAGQIELNPVNGNLVLNASVFNDNSKPYFVFGDNAKTLTINTTLGGTSSAVTFNIEQNSNVVLKAAQNYGGETFIRAGRLQFDTGGSVSTTIRLGATTGSANAAIDLIAAGGGITVDRTINPRSGTTGNTLSFNSQNTSGTNVYSGHFGLDHDLLVTQSTGGTLNITQLKGVDNSTGFDIKGFTTTLQAAATGTINVSGTIYNSTGSGNITKTGAGTLILSAANTYGGTTTVNAGALVAGANAPSGSAGALGNASSAVNLGDTTGSENASLLTNGAFTVGRSVLVRSGNTGVVTIGGSTATSSTFSGNITLGTASGTAKGVTLVTAPGGSADFSGVINENTSVPNSDVTIGSGTQTGTVRLSNTGNGYTGVTTINSATLEVTELDTGGSNSSIGNASTAASNLVLSGGTLRYIGGGVATTNRLFTFDANGATLDANANVSFTGAGPLVASGTGNRSLSLIGTNTGSLVSVIPNPSSGVTSLIKDGGGTWTLAGNNTYSGTTAVSAGTLRLSGTHSANGDYTVASGATLGGGGTINFSSPHSITINGAISPGTSPGSFTIGTNSTTVMAAAGQYTWEINAQTGSAGVNWDFLSLQAVSVTATSTVGQKFKIKVVSLDGSNNPGLIPGWVPNSYQIYTIATFTGSGITAAILDRFELDLSQFQNTVGDGGMHLGVNGNDLIIVNVPEPSCAALTVCGAVAGLMRRGRRVRKTA